MTDWLEALWLYAFSTPERSTLTFTAATAIFTAVLAVSTIGLWRSTRKLWRVTRIAAEHIPHVERAYISGGANFLHTGDTVLDTSSLVVTINNYGKTPAFIGTVAVATSDKLRPKFKGPWHRQEWKGYVLPAPTHNLVSDVGCAYEKDKIIFGRIWYRDIFQRCHSCGFALHMREGLPAVAGHDAYWEDRDEPDLGPAVRSQSWLVAWLRR
jgi:hypothetical protein